MRQRSRARHDPELFCSVPEAAQHSIDNRLSAVQPKSANKEASARLQSHCCHEKESVHCSDAGWRRTILADQKGNLLCHLNKGKDLHQQHICWQ